MVAFLIAMIAVFFAGGIPGVLFARLLAAIGLNKTLAVVAGSSFIPAMLVGAMANWQFSGLSRVPWVGPIATLAGGISASFIYFRYSRARK